MIILGVDPGSLITGYGLIEFNQNKFEYLDSGCIRLSEKNTFERLKYIYEDLKTLILRYSPEESAIEQIFMHLNPGGALKLGQARGAAIVALTHHSIPVSEYSARQVKLSVTGYGAAKKIQVQTMVKTLLNLPKSPQADAADALAIAICHAHYQKTNSFLKKHLIKKRKKNHD